MERLQTTTRPNTTRPNQEKVMYKPLPESLTIKQSGINGLGLFADQKIMQSTNLGMSHLELGKLILRTPLGGFINHSN